MTMNFGATKSKVNTDIRIFKEKQRQAEGNKEDPRRQELARRANEAMTQMDDLQEDKAGTRWDKLSRKITEIEEDIFQVVKAKHMHNENHEKIIKKLVGIRNVGTLDKID